MSNRPYGAPYAVITNGDMSQATITSSVTILAQCTYISYGYSWAGSTPVGTIAVQVSNDYSKNADGTVKNAGTWTTIYFSYNGSVVNSVPVSGNTGNGMIDIGPISVYAIRTVYTKGSGTGTLQCTMTEKVA